MCASTFKAWMCQCSVLQKCGSLWAATTKRLVQRDRWRRLGRLRRGNTDTYRTKSVPASLPFLFPVSLLIILGLNNVILIASTFFSCFINRPGDSRYSIKKLLSTFFIKCFLSCSSLFPLTPSQTGFLSVHLWEGEVPLDYQCSLSSSHSWQYLGNY